MLTSATGAVTGLDPARLFTDIANEPAVGIAVSGGADSLALMVLYARWAETAKAPRAIVYTLDHRLRAEAEAETALVARLAADLGFEVRVLRWEAAKPQAGIQAHARRARYRLIGQQMARDGANVLLTGHHRRDQAETILMRMAHGSGVSGLRGMQRHARVEGIRVFRPLLSVAPEDLTSIVRAAGLAAVADPSNLDTAYERVRWRQILPQFAALGLTEARLEQLGRRLARVDALANERAESFLLRSVGVDDFGIYRVAIDALGGEGDEIAIRVLCTLIAGAGGGHAPGLGQVETLWDTLFQGSVSGGHTLAGAKVAVSGADLVVYREAGRLERQTLELSQDVPHVWDGRFEIVAHRPGLSVSSAHTLTRKRAMALMDVPDIPPMDRVHAAPLIHDEGGRVVALGARVLAAEVSVRHVTLTSPA